MNAIVVEKETSNSQKHVMDDNELVDLKLRAQEGNYNYLYLINIVLKFCLTKCLLKQTAFKQTTLHLIHC